MNKSLTITRMNRSNLTIVDSLRKLENWNQTLTDLERFVSYEPNGCFLANWDGEPVGTVTTTTYGQQLGWIGMMLVHPDHRRKGIASALIEQSLDYLKAKGVRCIKLDATPAGEPVYRRLGFQPEWEFERWERSGSDAPTVEIAHTPTFQTPENDQTIFGAERSQWLKLLASGSRVVRKENAYGMLRPGSRAGYVGPIIASHPDIAQEILQELLSDLTGRLFWDVPIINEAAVKLAKQFKFKPVRQLLRMWTGQQLLAGDVSQQYAIADPATG